jgi:hypothetical protein
MNDNLPTIDRSSTYLAPGDDVADPSIPLEFICPITLEMMNQPMVTRYGHTYERQAIMEWLGKGNGYCPLTRHALSYSDIIPHYSLESKIRAWRQQYNNNNNKVASVECSKSSSSYHLSSMQPESLATVIGILNLSPLQQNHWQSHLSSPYPPSNTRQLLQDIVSTSTSAMQSANESAPLPQQHFSVHNRGATHDMEDAMSDEGIHQSSSRCKAFDAFHEVGSDLERRRCLYRLLEDIEHGYDEMMSASD